MFFGKKGENLLIDILIRWSWKLCEVCVDKCMEYLLCERLYCLFWGKDLCNF